MAFFSQRSGYRPLKKDLQQATIDSELRNRLWSAIDLCVVQHWTGPFQYGYQEPDSVEVENVMRLVWLELFKRPSDAIPAFEHGGTGSSLEGVREYFFRCEWWAAFDLMEFVLEYIPSNWADTLTIVANRFLEEENSAYRIVGKKVVPITAPEESEAVQSALEDGLAVVRKHFETALQKLSDRKQPDYRNAVKEAISAVEAACQTITGKPKATLGDCLKVLKNKIAIHPAFEASLNKLYGYTSDDGGIRHALSDSSVPVSFADAKYMVVSCAAFTNYLWAKAAELGVKIPKK